jgi:hypothetical protein
MYDLDQVALRVHDGVDGLIGHWGFVDYAQILAAFSGIYHTAVYLIVHVSPPASFLLKNPMF